MATPSKTPGIHVPPYFLPRGGGRPDPRVARSPASRPGTPIFLTASASVDASAGGAPNTEALKNPTGGPMEIDAISFRLSVPSSTVAAIGGALGCELALGKIPLTNGSVPVWSFGKGSARNFEEITFGSTYYGHFMWRLDKPFYVPAGMVVEPSFRGTGLLNLTTSVDISYSARALSSDKLPETAHVPFAAYYSTGSSIVIDSSGSTVNKYTSPETALTNPTGFPLNVERFTGRLPVYDAAGTQVSEWDSGNAFSETYNMANIRMISSRGDPLVRGKQPFRTVFSRQTRSWECPHVMDPGMFYTVFVETVPLPISGLRQFMQLHIGMIGYRDMPIKNLLGAA